MTEKEKERFEAIEKIRKLPKLKHIYSYEIGINGGVYIWKGAFLQEVLFGSFDSFVNNEYSLEPDKYENYFDKPIYKEVITKKIAGYE